MLTQRQALDILLDHPIEYARLLGLDRLTELHNDWIKRMVTGRTDITLQAHRGSYKTTCVSIALAIIIMLLPTKRTLFMRKAEADVKEIMRQVQ